TDVWKFPFPFSRRRIDRAQRAPRAVVRTGGALAGAARVPLTWDVVLLPRVKRRTHFACVHEEQALRWIVGPGPEIGRARRIGTRQRTFFIGDVPGQNHGSSISSDFFRPGGYDIRFADDELSVRAVEGVEELVAV